MKQFDNQFVRTISTELIWTMKSEAKREWFEGCIVNWKITQKRVQGSKLQPLSREFKALLEHEVSLVWNAGLPLSVYKIV